jgi:archaellum component FlaC
MEIQRKGPIMAQVKKSTETEKQAKEEKLSEVQSQIDSIKKQLAELNLKSKVEGLSADAKKIYTEQRKELEGLIEEIEKKVKGLATKANDGWQDTKDFVELTNKALKHSFNYFMSHYK